MDSVTLHTPRLTLSVPTIADVDAIHAACQDAEIQKYTTVPTPYLREDAVMFIGQVVGDWARGSALIWAIRLEGRLIGMLDLHAVAGGNATVGYWLEAGERGRGYLREAMAAVLDFGFADDGLQLARIEWQAVAGNTASARAAQALGFHYEGTLRQSMSTPLGRADAWVAGLLPTDARIPQPWPVLAD
ncbi:GNAT family N-acetyltransferase [Microbacterium sp. P05]|uniref:GNAT family N-acetyltransferase n=1 Tax=Microbacterium sp. P05 TaxID=3366948 RepID=UPI0037467DCF